MEEKKLLHEQKSDWHELTSDQHEMTSEKHEIPSDFDKISRAERVIIGVQRARAGAAFDGKAKIVYNKK